MSRRRWVTLWGTVAVWAATGWFSAQAQRIVVVKPGDGKAGLDWSAFRAAGDPASQTLLKVVLNDLTRSGWFRITRGGGEFRVEGDARGGGRLDVGVRIFSNGTGDSVFSQSFSGELRDARAVAHRVADEIVKALTGREGFAASRFVLSGNRTGKKELYLCDADGGNLSQLTRDNSISIFPRWSPDGGRILYTSFLKRYPDVYQIELGSGRRDRIARFNGLNMGASYSPDGRTIALILSKDGMPDLYLMSPGGGAVTRLTRDKAAKSTPSFSPDGGQLVFVSDKSGSPQLYLLSRAGGEPRRLTSRGAQNVSPHWGPGGLIACSTLEGGRYHITVIDPRSGQATPYVPDGADYEDPSWARDGRHIACTRQAGGRRSVCLIDMVTGEKVEILAGNGDWFSPSLSP